jgi:hypothetical protein
MSKRLALLLAFCASLSMATSCGGDSSKDGSKPVHPKHKGPRISWLELSHRDTLNLGDSATFVYPFVNDGWSDVWLTEVENDGSYCSADWPKQHLRIWDTAQVTLTCHFDHPGFVAQAIMVHYRGDSGSAALQTALTYYAVVRDSKGNLPEAPAPANTSGNATGVKH